MSRNTMIRIFKNNDKYFEFVNRDDIKIYKVEFTDNKQIRVIYRRTFKKHKNRKDVNRCIVGV